MKKIAFFAVGVIAMISLASCDLTKSMVSTYQMTQCNYTYKNISNIDIAGIKLGQGFSLSQLSKITTLLSGNFSDLPVEFDVNMNVQNPNSSTAAVEKLDFDVAIDGLNMGQGSVNTPFTVNPGETKTLPLRVKIDLASLLTKDNRGTVIEIAKNFAGLSDKESKVNVKIKPYFKSGKKLVAGPSIPVSFKYNGKSSK